MRKEELMHEFVQEKRQRRRDELRFALDPCGFGSSDIKNMYAKAFVLAAAIQAKREVPVDNQFEQLKSFGKVSSYLLAADMLLQQEECLRGVSAKRKAWHPLMVIWLQHGDQDVLVDWLRIRSAEGFLLAKEKNDHPLSLDRF